MCTVVHSSTAWEFIDRFFVDFRFHDFHLCLLQDRSQAPMAFQSTRFCEVQYKSHAGISKLDMHGSPICGFLYFFGRALLVACSPTHAFILHSALFHARLTLGAATDTPPVNLHHHRPVGDRRSFFLGPGMRVLGGELKYSYPQQNTGQWY